VSWSQIWLPFLHLDAGQYAHNELPSAQGSQGGNTDPAHMACLLCAGRQSPPDDNGHSSSTWEVPCHKPDRPCCMQAPGSVHKLNYLQHREEKVAADLALMASLLSSSRQNNTIGDMGATYSTQASMKMSGKDMTAKMAATTMLKRTARTKCKRVHKASVCCIGSWTMQVIEVMGSRVSGEVTSVQDCMLLLC